MEAAIAEQDRLNRLAAGYYGIAIAGLVAMPIINHSIKTICNGRSPMILRPLLRPLKRVATAVTFGNVLVMPFHILLALVFVGLNVGLTAWKMSWPNQAYLGSRLGWLALCNMCLAIFLGLKNTPMSLLAAHTYRDLNFVHRFCGYTTVIEVILHGSLFSSGLYQHHASQVLRQAIVYAGAVAGVAMLLIGITASSPFRTRFYETFYLLHLVLIAIILVAMALHQPWIQTGALIVTIIAASIWIIDRLIRFWVWAWNAKHGYCTLLPLPLGATKVILNDNVRAVPGSHAYLWIPGIRLLQQHPFSILNDGRTEFVVTARNGFTRALYDAACQKPGIRYRSSIVGPYGLTPDLARHNKCLMIAGGSGATFALSLAQAWLRTAQSTDANSSLQFVWVVRSATHLQWLSDELQALKSHPQATVILHVTGSNSSTKELADGEAISTETSPDMTQDREDSRTFLVADLEKTAMDSRPSLKQLDHRHSRLHHFFHHGRPVIDEIFSRVLADIQPSDRLLVTGSGPARLLTDIRAATAEQIKIRGPSVTLHIEEYEW